MGAGVVTGRGVAVGRGVAAAAVFVGCGVDVVSSFFRQAARTKIMIRHMAKSRVRDRVCFDMVVSS
jgi:hypothetical protein